MGKFYKLQFRRDLANVQSNQLAWPEGALFEETNFDGAVGHDINVAPLLLRNLAKESQPPMVWRSGTRSVAGIQYAVNMIITDPLNIDQTDIDFIVLQLSPVKTLHQWRSSANFHSGSPSHVLGVGGTVITQTPLCFIPSGTPNWDFKAADWQHYNP